VVDAILATLGEIDEWARGNSKAAAEQLSPTVGIPAPILEIALSRQGYGVRPITDEVVAEQQKIADTFQQLNLIPKPITVADAVRRAKS
jgi:sulfonate transport system substrate-binding protein